MSDTHYQNQNVTISPYEEIDSLANQSLSSNSSSSSSLEIKNSVNSEQLPQANNHQMSQTSQISQMSEEAKQKAREKRSKRNSFRRMFGSNDKEEKNKEPKENKEKNESGGLSRTLSGMFKSDKSDKSDKRERDNHHNNDENNQNRRRNENNESPTKRKNRRSFIFFSDDERETERKELTVKRRDIGSSTSDVENNSKQSKNKQRNRLSLNIEKLLGLDDDSNNNRYRSNTMSDLFIQENETPIRSHSRHNSGRNSPISPNKSETFPSISGRDSPITSNKSETFPSISSTNANSTSNASNNIPTDINISTNLPIIITTDVEEITFSPDSLISDNYKDDSSTAPTSPEISIDEEKESQNQNSVPSNIFSSSSFSSFDSNKIESDIDKVDTGDKSYIEVTATTITAGYDHYQENNSQEISQNNNSQVNSKEISQDSFQDVSKDIPKEISQEISQDSFQDISQDIPQEISQEISQDNNSQKISQDNEFQEISQEISKDNNFQDISQDYSQDSNFQHISHDNFQDISQEISQNNFRDISHDYSLDNSQVIVENTHNEGNDDEDSDNKIQEIQNNHSIPSHYQEKYEDSTPSSPLSPISPSYPYSSKTQKIPKFVFTNSDSDSDYVNENYEEENSDIVIVERDRFHTVEKVVEKQQLPKIIEKKIIITQESPETLQKLEELQTNNDSLISVKRELESKILEQSQQIDKLASLETVMIRQIQLTERIEEAMRRLENRVNDKEDLKEKHTGHVEDSVRQLESKIGDQFKEINGLRIMMEQLQKTPELYFNENQIITTRSLTEEINANNALIPSRVATVERVVITTPKQNSRESLKNTLVNTLVVKPLVDTITISTSLATSIFYAVYIKPVVIIADAIIYGGNKCYRTYAQQ